MQHIPVLFSPETSVSFTGPRDKKLLGSPAFTGDFKAWNKDLTNMYSPLAEALSKQIDEAIAQGKTTFITGCATGVDTIAASVVSKKIITNPTKDLHLVLAWPKVGFGKQNPPWFHILTTLGGKDYTINVDVEDALDQEAKAHGQEAIAERYRRNSRPFVFLQDRNEFMLYNSSRVIAVWPDKTEAKDRFGKIIYPDWRTYAKTSWKDMKGSGTGNALRDATKLGREIDTIICSCDGGTMQILGVEKNYIPKNLQAGLSLCAENETEQNLEF